jgi:putative phage-type endonuclease
MPEISTGHRHHFMVENARADVLQDIGNNFVMPTRSNVNPICRRSAPASTTILEKIMIKQGTEEWHKQRVGMITGSRVGAILGLNPWSSRDDVMRQMVREYHGASCEFTGNVATEYGKINEVNAIFELEMEHGIEVEDTGFHIHPDLPWLGASPDGLVSPRGVVEIKAPYGLRNDKNPTFKTAAEQPHYYAQTQIEMACTYRGKCYFYQWNLYASKLEMVYFDHKWMDENIPKLHEFYLEYLRDYKKP